MAWIRTPAPQYPAKRLFRQATRGDWTTVLERVSHARRKQSHHCRRRLSPRRMLELSTFVLN
jgi:hypothetical protein